MMLVYDNKEVSNLTRARLLSNKTRRQRQNCGRALEDGYSEHHPLLGGLSKSRTPLQWWGVDNSVLPSRRPQL